MPDHSANARPELEEQLVAYLDGELDGQSSHRIEELLASDPEVRRTLQRLDRTWELLGELETPRVDEHFTRSTLEMVTVAAAKEVEQSQASAPRRRARRWLIAGGGVAAVGLAGFLAFALWTPDRNQRLLEELPVLENFEQYSRVDDVEFLRVLSREKVFDRDEEGN